MNEDSELLRRYIEDHAEDAFAELVHRHLGLVYAAALRRVAGDAHLARDVAQQVFIDLARKAATLRGRPTLTAWLCVSTHFAAAAVVRAELRRKFRETEAHSMQTLLHDATPEPEWSHLRPVLDEVFVALRDDEREAIALRFFEKRRFAEIGAALRLSEEAARKRLERALEKLRARLGRRGITSSTALLSLALGEFTVSAAPPGLAANITAHALTQGSAIGTTALISSWLHAGTIAASVAVLLLGTFAVTHQHGVNQRLEGELAALQSNERAAASLRDENQRLARLITEADAMRRATADLPALRTAFAALPPTPPPPAPAPPSLRVEVTIQSKGELLWDSERVTLDEFLAHLRELQANSPQGESRLDVRNHGEFAHAAYVIDEARKAGIKHVVVEGGTEPTKTWPMWFWF